MEQKEIDFIARHYRKDRFRADTGWHRLGIVSFSNRKRFRIAAAVAATVIISATAAIIYHEYHPIDIPEQIVTYPEISPLTEVKVIDFENASLFDVVKKIETVYDVKIENMPEQCNEYQLSLHYEGNPIELIEVINDILGTNMTVEEK